MGGGNVAKANTARARKMAAAASEGKASSSDDRKKHAASLVAVQCNICMQGFPATVRATELTQHLEARHAKLNKTIPEVFPMFTGETF